MGKLVAAHRAGPVVAQVLQHRGLRVFPAGPAGPRGALQLQHRRRQQCVAYFTRLDPPQGKLRNQTVDQRYEEAVRKDVRPPGDPARDAALSLHPEIDAGQQERILGVGEDRIARARRTKEQVAHVPLIGDAADFENALPFVNIQQIWEIEDSLPRGKSLIALI
jgi:hypothetical protein